MLPTQIIPAPARARILNDLAHIESRENVRILFAIESGSRAWGFPSPDSDYDARFVYARAPDWYLSLTPGRDVIELPIAGDFDINGWDIRKALGLLLKPNPVLLEWLSSPIRYIWNDEVCQTLIALASRTAFAEACVQHYYGVARRLSHEFLDGRETVNLKKYLYVVRPALCLMWVRERRSGAPPMSLPDMMAALPVTDDFRRAIEQLLAAKAQTSEVGDGPRVAALDALIDDQMRWVEQQARPHAAPAVSLRAEAETLFRAIIKST
jgi:uncharacterized protein